MAHIQDRWYRPKKDPETGKPVLNARGKPVMEKTELHGVGHRYKVRYIDPDGEEQSRSFPDRQKKQAEDFLIGVENDKREGRVHRPEAGAEDVPCPGRQLDQGPVGRTRPRGRCCVAGCGARSSPLRRPADREDHTGHGPGLARRDPRSSSATTTRWSCSAS